MCQSIGSGGGGDTVFAVTAVFAGGGAVFDVKAGRALNRRQGAKSLAVAPKSPEASSKVSQG